MNNDLDSSAQSPEPTPTLEEAPPPLPNNPRFVSTAMASSYWAGRFSSARDRFHSELLTPRNLNLIIEAQNFQAMMSSDLNNSASNPSAPTASAYNNPSTSVYASSRIIPTQDFGFDTAAKRLPNADQLGLKTTENRHIPYYVRNRITHSATTDAILQTPRKSSTYVSDQNPAVYRTVQHKEISNSKGPSPSMIPTRVIPRSESSRILPRRPLPDPPVSESSRVLPRRPLPDIPVSESSRVIHIYTDDTYNDDPSASFRMKNTDRRNRIMSESQAKAKKEREIMLRKEREDMLRRVTVADATALTDDDNRCRRVFCHLEACCVTDEARNSLYAWQQDYARKTKREVLLPRGGTIHDPRGFRSSVFGRSLFGSRRSMGSLPTSSGGGIVTTGLNVDLGQPRSEVRSSKTERSLLQVPRRVFTHGRSASMKVDTMEPSSYGHHLERHGTVRGVNADNEVRKGRYQHRMSLA
ncbi:hypothetical protein QBC32DRAFT_342583 [Pseudoneurospora amorphoporcata]|uniref:Uncharacterized protein n=1 Tax=Pseudoneurospora amorphoporcata TaxID=241081 RepID=A0AAN6SFV2_9PEZI|nr:hypothetical protein QBC32DRAFT_342583 [Pseudoneurospora amorphoporcata]